MGRVISLIKRCRGEAGLCGAPTVSHHKKVDFFMGLFFWGFHFSLSIRLSQSFLCLLGVFFNLRNNVGLFLYYSLMRVLVSFVD